MLDQIPRQLDMHREGIKGREDGERRGGVIIQGRQLFQMFPSKGDNYSREMINQEMAIIRGNMVYWLPPIFVKEQSSAITSN